MTSIGETTISRIELAARLPGVRSASLSHLMPITNFEWKETVASASSPWNGGNPKVNYEVVSPNFFMTMGIPVLWGRSFRWRDGARSNRVAIISDSLERWLYGAHSAIGYHIRVGTDPARQDIEIVGVTGNASLWDIRKPRPLAVFVPYLQELKFAHWPSVEVRTEGDPEALALPPYYRSSTG